MGSEENNRAVWGQILVLSVTLRNAIYSGACRNATTVAHEDDHELEMKLDAERRRLTSSVTTLSICIDIVKQRMIPGDSNDKRLTNTDSISTTSFTPTLVSL